MPKKLERELGKEVRGVAPKALGLLLTYSWPGNVRELKNVMERAAILARGEMITPEDLPLELRQERTEGKNSFLIEDWMKNVDGFPSLAAVERNYILKVLGERKGNKSQTARILGISRSTLREKLNRYGISS